MLLVFCCTKEYMLMVKVKKMNPTLFSVYLHLVTTPA